MDIFPPFFFINDDKLFSLPPRSTRLRVIFLSILLNSRRGRKWRTREYHSSCVFNWVILWTDTVFVVNHQCCTLLQTDCQNRSLIPYSKSILHVLFLEHCIINVTCRVRILNVLFSQAIIIVIVIAYIFW